MPNCALSNINDSTVGKEINELEKLKVILSKKVNEIGDNYYMNEISAATKIMPKMKAMEVQKVKDARQAKQDA